MANNKEKKIEMTAMDVLCCQNDLKEANEYVYFYNQKAYATDGIAVARVPLSKMGFSIGEAIQLNGTRVHRTDFYTMRKMVGRILEVNAGYIKAETKRGKVIVMIPYKSNHLNYIPYIDFERLIEERSIDKPPVCETKFNFKHIMISDMVMTKDDKKKIELRDKTLIIRGTSDEIFITHIL